MTFLRKKFPYILNLLGNYTLPEDAKWAKIELDETVLSMLP